MEEIIDFGNLTPIRIPFVVEGKQYYLVEASGESAATYLDACVAATRIEDGKPIGMSSYACHQLRLLASCIVQEDGRTPVGMKVVGSWPSRITNKLYAKLEEISELMRVPAESVPNGPSVMLGGSE